LVAVGSNDYTELHTVTDGPEAMLARYLEDPEKVLMEEFGWKYNGKAEGLVRVNLTSEELGL
jgi:hypothetical protein